MGRGLVLLLLASACLLSACKPNVAAARANLASMDPRAREEAAAVLQRAYAKDPSSLGDHGEAYWKAQLARLPGASDAESSRILAGSRYEGGEGGGGGETEHWRLDDFWAAEIFRDTRRGVVFGYDPPRRRVEHVDVLVPTGFDGTWRTYYVNGAIFSELELRGGVLQRTRELFDDGKVHVERAFVGGKLHGVVLTHFRDGSTEWEERYENGDKVGVERWYWPGGKVRQEAHYVADKLEGRMTNFDTGGLPTSCAEYRAGVEIATGCGGP